MLTQERGIDPPLERNPKEDDWKAFQKVQPKFYLDKDWDVFYGDWVVMARKFRLSEASLKNCLYWAVQDGAKKLIYPDFLPDKRQVCSRTQGSFPASRRNRCGENRIRATSSTSSREP